MARHTHTSASPPLPFLLPLLLPLLLLLLLSPPPSLGAALFSMGPHGRAPRDASRCPTACKVRDISILGAGTTVAAASADACIRACRSKGKPHYSWSQNAALCSCGRCLGGFSAMAARSRVLSGSTAACVAVPQCSMFLPLGPGAKDCPAGAVKRLGRGSKAAAYQCCCQGSTPFPMVVSGTLVACTADGI